jgi:hypothetical protein
VTLEVPRYPAGVLRFGDGVVEILGGGEGTRIAVRDLDRIEVGPVKLGKVKVKVRHRAGVGDSTNSFLVEPSQRDAVLALVDAAHAARDAAQG